MKRDIYHKLLTWKTSARRKPLLLRGARQTGKTYILNAFGAQEYEHVHYLNFEEHPEFDAFFQRDLDPNRILEELQIALNRAIVPRRDLIIFDEIQSSSAALNSLKYFQEKANDHHIAAAGSLLGIKLSSPGSFPVGKVQFLDLYPLSFLEFLEAMGQARYRTYLDQLDQVHPLPDPFHRDLIDLLRKYYVVGGMPEAVKHYSETKNLLDVRDIQKEISDSYLLDFAKHAPTTDAPKLSLIWNAIPAQLARENKKFIFSAVKKGARARGYEDAITWLEDAGLIHRACAVEKSVAPLKHHANTSCFKIYSLDVGMLGAMLNLPIDMVVQAHRVFDACKGAFVENYVAQQLVTILEDPLFYWRSASGQAEVDFLLERDGMICPIEVKSGINPKSKSLKSYRDKYQPNQLVRITLLNLKQEDNLLNIPLYAINLLSRFT